MVDTDRYPIHRTDTPDWRTSAAAVRSALDRTGCAVLAGFIRPEHLDRLRAEGDRIAPDAHYETARVNVYNTDVDDLDPDLAREHPARVVMDRGNAFVARDRIPEDLTIHRLYRDPRVHAFLAACAGLPALYELADPLAGLCLNVIPPGRSHPWHFDTNEIAISLLTRAPSTGGRFEYCPDIRATDRENTGDVADVLAGRRTELVHGLALTPGDLQLFRGRYSLHRVTPVGGTRARHTAIFSFSTRPGVVGTEERTRQLFGRVLSEHRAAQPQVDDLLI
ncbi:arpA protein [Pseudonocardia tropica]|uniref:ArpA protein n=1 Tax=Pseudonocardia tropica TaxID=681289 RepID=A0ABV1JXR7_9PSEU